MSNRYLVIVQAPDCLRHSPLTFVINGVLFDGILNAVGYRLHSTDLSYEDALALAAAIDQLPRTQRAEVGWALCGDPGGGVDALVDFLNGGSFEIVNGETTRPEDLR
jgi:hypothetical protein